MLQDFFSFSSSYELLSPQNIRNGVKSSNGHHNYDIGINGEELAQCIENMSETDKQRLNKTLFELTGQILSVGTMDYGNKIKILLNERINDAVISINSSHISDGLLRFIAFSVISQNYDFPLLSYTDQRGLILFDEVEDGINLYLTEKIINLLRVTIKNSGRQIIVTTHSPVILNDFNPEEIVFLWKGEDGSAHSRKFFETEEMRKSLDFLNPGEIWENYGKDAILSKLGIPSVEQ
jgi:predicted ATPase